MSLRILVTGANGYIGSWLGRALAQAGYSVRGVIRSALDGELSGYRELSVVGDIGGSTEWRGALKDVECIVHLAARAHRTNESPKDSEVAYMEVNCNGTANIAKQAAMVGVKRFIYISSIGVHGDRTEDSPFSDESPYAPASAYAVSKMKAEIELEAISRNSNMEVVIIRPPLVYGENAPGNFLRLLKLVNLGVPLPLGGLHSKKSMISIVNLSDFIVKCVSAPNAANNKFVVSDGADWSTSELVRLIADYMNKRIYLIPVPGFILRMIGVAVGQSTAVAKLSHSLQVDISASIDQLAWVPPQCPEDALKRAVERFIENRCK